MVKYIKIFAIFSLSLLFTISAPFILKGQRLVAVATSTQVGLGEVFQITWELQGAEGEISLPRLNNDFDVVGGPSQQSSYSIVNGRMSQSVSVSYALRPRRIGSFTIGPASVNVGKGNLQSNPITIKVIQGNSNAQNNQRGGGGNQGGSSNGKGGEYFIRAWTDKTSIIEGEPITLTYAFYLSNAGLEQLQVRKSPSFNGFWVKDLPNAVDKDFHEEMYNGKKYLVAVLKKTILYPQKSGNLSADVLSADAIITLKAKKKINPFSNDPFFDDFDDFFNQTEAFRKTIISNQVLIPVIPLPQKGKPANFSGLVGQFSLKNRINKTEVKENDILTYTVTIEGAGNIEQVQAPTLNLPSDWELYDPKTIDKPGSRTFEYTIIPKKRGKTTITPPEFSYFDLNTRQYKTLSGTPFDVTITPGVGGGSGGGAGISSTSKEDIKLLNEDIRFIHQKTELEPISSSSNAPSPLQIMLIIGPILSSLGLFLIAKKRDKDKKDVLGNKIKKASGVAKKRLQKAKSYQLAGQSEAFFNETLSAIYGFIKDKTGMEFSEMTTESMSTNLKIKGASEGVINQTIQLINNIEMAKYASGAVHLSLDEVYDQSSEVIEKLNNELIKQS